MTTSPGRPLGRRAPCTTSRAGGRCTGSAVARPRSQQGGSEWGQGVQDRVGVAVAGDQAGVAQFGGVMAGRRGGSRRPGGRPRWWWSRSRWLSGWRRGWGRAARSAVGSLRAGSSSAGGGGGRGERTGARGRPERWAPASRSGRGSGAVLARRGGRRGGPDSTTHRWRPSRCEDSNPLRAMRWRMARLRSHWRRWS